MKSLVYNAVSLNTSILSKVMSYYGTLICKTGEKISYYIHDFEPYT